jgi:hypothetical protein
MFFPRAMTEIELVVPSRDLLAVTKILSRHGVFHQTDSNYPGVNTGSSSTWQETAAARRAGTQAAGHHAVPGDRRGARLADFDTVIELDQIRTVVDLVEGEPARSATSSVRRKAAEIPINLNQLEPVAAVDIDIRLRSPSICIRCWDGCLPPM